MLVLILLLFCAISACYSECHYSNIIENSQKTSEDIEYDSSGGCPMNFPSEVICEDDSRTVEEILHDIEKQQEQFKRIRHGKNKNQMILETNVKSASLGSSNEATEVHQPGELFPEPIESFPEIKNPSIGLQDYVDYDTVATSSESGPQNRVKETREIQESGTPSITRKN